MVRLEGVDYTKLVVEMLRHPVENAVKNAIVKQIHREGLVDVDLAHSAPVEVAVSIKPAGTMSAHELECALVSWAGRSTRKLDIHKIQQILFASRFPPRPILNVL